MNKEQKRKLAVIVALGVTLLVGGTFAFRAFEQQAINDRENDHLVNIGGRVHDYYNRDTENKDVFVENYGDRPIMARIRLSEFLETRQRDEENFTPLVTGSSRENIGSWVTYTPSAENVNNRQGDSAEFAPYTNLTFGWARGGQVAPWYLPTFNHDNADERTAAAGHARDWIAGNGATDGTTDGTTHPGEGTDAFWSAGQNYDNSDGTWFGSADIRDTAQNLRQDRAPITMEQWVALAEGSKIGNFWVIDHTTGWAYWANQLQRGQATSYLLDAAELTEALDDRVFNGSSYYAINVESDLASLEQGNVFLEDGDDHHVALANLLDGIKSGAMHDDGENPASNQNAEPSAFNFSTMRPGRVFTMAGTQYRYLEDMGDDNHMIQTMRSARNVSFDEQEEYLTAWYAALPSSFRSITARIQSTFVTGETGSLTFGGLDPLINWRPTNLNAFAGVAEDETRVMPYGTARAFALSVADVTRLSGPGRAFQNGSQRLEHDWWWTRTPRTGGRAWSIQHGSRNPVAVGGFGNPYSSIQGDYGGVRPALVIRQVSN